MAEPWLVVHNGHRAWAQRAFMIGDFAPGRVVAAWYIVDVAGRWADPDVPPVCGTCGEVPHVDDLEVIEVATGISGFLARVRAAGRWPRPTDPATCWACNCPGLELMDGRLCLGCAAHLAGQQGVRAAQSATPSTRNELLAARVARQRR